MSIANTLKSTSNVITSKVGRQILKGKKHSPVILFGAGVVGVVATAVMASKATLKLVDVFEDYEGAQNRVNDLVDLDRLDKVEYSSSAHKKDVAILKVNFVKDCARLYSPTVIVGALSIASLTGSHVILTRRNTAVMAAYATLDKSFKEYQKRAEERFGSAISEELKFGVEEREIAEDTDSGTVVKSIRTAAGVSQYARFFDELCPSWSPQPEYNLITLQMRQQWANDMLWARGHVFLNEVYDQFGFDRTRAGQVVGWVKGNGDDFIDFGFMDGNNPRARDFVNGREGAILLDFNVDGIVLDLIGKDTK